MKRTVLTVAASTLGILLGLGVSLGSTPAQACTLEDCPGMPACYSTYGWKFCNVVYGYNPPYGHWTSVNTYNHTRYGAVADAWYNLGYPPSGTPTNSLYLHTDGVNNSSHDIDYWETSDLGGWWGETSWPGGISGSCINPGGGMVVLNVPAITSSYTWQLWVAEHETGHAVGLRHVCGCSDGRIMNPCTECASPATISWCDASGINSLYH